MPRSVARFTFLSVLVLLIHLANPLLVRTQASIQAEASPQAGPAATAVPQSPQQQPTYLLPYRVYISSVQTVPTYSVSGQIIDSLGNPLPGITVTLSSGQSAVSDSFGSYILNNLQAGTYTYSASGSGLVFSPVMRTATVPPNLTGKNFTSLSTSPVSLNMFPFYHSQRTETNLPNACGPTSLLMALDYYGVNSGGLDQVILSTSLPPENGGFDSQCLFNPVCLSAGALAYVAQGTYKMTIDTHAGWTFDQLYSTLAGGKPVIALIAWALGPGGAGHFVVLYGADPVNRIVYYHDPYYGPARWDTWNNFYAAWQGPVDVGDPIQPAGHLAWGMALSR